MPLPPDFGPASLTGYVLAGGQSRRMLQDKAFLKVDGKPLIQHALENLRTACADVRILSGPPNPLRDALLSPYANLVPDTAASHQGPLAALAAALQDCPTPYALLLAVDQPAIPARALQQLIHSGTAHGVAAAGLQHGSRPEPLPLLASKLLQPGIARAVRNGQRRLLDTVAACALEQGSAMLYIDLEAGDQFINLNTPEDLRRWLEDQTSNQSAPGASETGNGR